MDGQAMTCGRRMGGVGPWERKEGLDHWVGNSPRRTCSFCGSLHPDDFLAAIKSGAEIGPTDKSYKFYVDGTGKFYTHHLNEQAQVDEFDHLWRGKRIAWGYPGGPYVPITMVVMPSRLSTTPKGTSAQGEH